MATKDTLTENRGWTWFPFDVRNWLTSQDVLAMTSSEEGLYIRMLAFQWMYDELPGDPRQLAKLLGRDQRQVSSFLKRWGGALFPEVPAIRCNLQQNATECGESQPTSENRRKVRNPKLYFLAVSQGKIDLGDAQSKPNTNGEGEGDKGGVGVRGPQPSAASPGTPIISSKEVEREPIEAEYEPEPSAPESGEEASALPESAPSAATAMDEPAALALRFYEYQGKPAKYKDALPEWTGRFRVLVQTYGDELPKFMNYAFKIDPFWSEKLIRGDDPLGYFEEKLKSGIIIEKFRSWNTAQQNRAKQPGTVKETSNGYQRNRTSSNRGKHEVDNRASADEAKRRISLRVRGGV